MNKREVRLKVIIDTIKTRLFVRPKAKQNKKDRSVLLETEKRIIVAVSELYKFNATFSRILAKIPEAEAQRFENKYLWFSKKILEVADPLGIQPKDFTGMEYDTGLPVAIINLEDFAADDSLIISQMLEPVIMKDGKLIKTGTALVTRKEKE